MILFLTLVLLFLMITIGGERGAVSIMALAGNIIILFFSVILMSAGYTVCNADSVYSDFCYYVENRKLWLK